jgi:ATP diphosphatase
VPAARPPCPRVPDGLRARSVGFDWSRPADVVDKIQEEVNELREVAGVPGGQERAEEEMGDLLFSIANLARQLGIEPETALRKANDKFTKRFETMEAAIGQSGRKMSDLNIDELEQEWRTAKTKGDR